MGIEHKKPPAKKRFIMRATKIFPFGCGGQREALASAFVHAASVGILRKNNLDIFQVCGKL
jgi:hypothetical protein